MHRSILTIISFIIISASLGAQGESMMVVVKDAETGKVLPYCNIESENLKNGRQDLFTTDDEGKTHVIIEDVTALNITYLGYKSYEDTIYSFVQTREYALSPDPFNIEQVVITGQNKPVPIDRSIYSIKLIGKREIEQKASTNLAELLKDDLNIQINNDPSLGSSVNLQGISGENVKILIDGVPVIGRLDGNIDLSQINLSDVDHVEIVEGPMSVIYGSNALAGVINIITRDNKRSSLVSTLDSYYESVGVYNLNGNLHLNHKDHGYGFNFGRNFFGGYSLDPDSRSKQWKPKEQYNTKFLYRRSWKGLQTKLKSDFFKERLLDRNEPFSPYFIKANDTWFNTLRINNSFHNDLKISPSSSANLMISYSYYNRKKNKYLKDLTNLESVLTNSVNDHDTTVFHAYIVRGSYNYENPNSNFSLQAGLDLNQETANGKRILNGHESMGDYAAFISGQWHVSKNFILQPSLRASYNTKYEAPFTPSFNIKYSRQNNAMRLSYARGFRAPSLKELYLYFYDSNHQIEGNEDLKAENSHNFNLVVDTRYTFFGSDVAWQISGFYNKINDKITLVNVDPANALHYRNENLGHFQSLGGSVKFEFKALDNLDIKLGFSRIGRKDDFYSTEKFIFSNNANINTSLKLLNNTANIAVFYKYFGKYPYYSYDEFDNIAVSFVQDYHNLDLSLNKKFFDYRLTLSAGVKNLFDNVDIAGTSAGSGGGAHSDGSSNLVGWGRTYFAGLKYKFQKD